MIIRPFRPLPRSHLNQGRRARLRFTLALAFIYRAFGALESYVATFKAKPLR